MEMPQIVKIPSFQIAPLQKRADLVGENFFGRFRHQDGAGPRHAKVSCGRKMRDGTQGRKDKLPDIRRFVRQKLFEFQLDGNLLTGGFRAEVHKAFQRLAAGAFGAKRERPRTEMGDHQIPRAPERRLEHGLDGLGGKGRHEIQIFRKAAAAVAPAQRRAALKNQPAALFLRIDLMQQNELRNFGFADMGFTIILHICLRYNTYLY